MYTYAVVTWRGICAGTYVVREMYVYICCCYMGRNMYKYIYCERDICMLCCFYMGRNMYKYIYVERDICIHMLLFLWVGICTSIHM